jgi:PAS domain S-box-containing protein
MTRDPDDHRSELLEYAGRVAATDDEQTVYEAMADTADRVLAFDSSVVETESDGFLEVRAWAGDEPVVDGIPADQGIAGHTYRSGESERVSDISDDPRVENAAESPHDSVLSVPIGTVGVFQAGRYEPDAFDDDDVELAELLASHAAQAVQRIRSQHELTESEARFRRLFEQAEDALVLYDVASDRSTDIVYANDAAESLFDRTERDLQGESLGELLDLDDRDELVPDSEHEVETPLTNRSPERIVSVRVRPFLRKSGPDAFAVIRDVTERRHRERTLTRLHDATRHMMAVESTTSIADLVVDAAERLFELPYVGVFVPRDEKLHLVAHSEDVPGEDLPVFEPGESLAWEVFEDGEPRMYEDVSDEPNAHNQDTILRQEIIHPLGDHGVLVVGASERDAFDRADRDLLRVLATNSEAALDRAARIRMLSRRESELRDERNRLAALFENIPSPTASFVVEDGSPIVRSVNPAFERVFGYSGDQLEGEPIDDYVVPMDNEDAPEHIVNKLERGESFSGEVQRVTANGPRHFLLDVVPFRLDEPHVHGYAMYTDITDRLKRERELKRQNDRLDEFASIVSHDLRNPLNVARGYLELASETGDDVHFRRADDALDRMNDIIASVLTLAREGRSLDETEDVALADAAKRAWRNVDTADATLVLPNDRVAGNGDRTAVETIGGLVDDAEDTPAENATVLDADPSRLASLLENLFRNSIEHAGDDVTVSVQPTPEGFAVADDGPGIPAHRREDVLKSGETTADDGTGFGLAIVENIAEAHGWTISVAESTTSGAKFVFAT